jgi:hypothetical protein
LSCRGVFSDVSVPSSAFVLSLGLDTPAVAGRDSKDKHPSNCSSEDVVGGIKLGGVSYPS